MTPQEVLVSHKDYFEHVGRTGECEISDNRAQAILAAYKHFNPQFILDSCCASCVFGMIDKANELRKSFEPKHYTFPKQEQ